jgi:hypothetical protein
MSGLFRRFRRPKPKDGEEPVEESGEPTESDSDIYPHRAPDRTGDPDIEGAPPEAPPGPDEASDVVAGPPVLPDEIGPPPAEPQLPTPTAPEAPPPPSPTAPERPPVPPGTERAPTRPPLPEADADAGRAVHRPLSPPTRCFLCGTEMTGSFCPTCRMTWNE